MKFAHMASRDFSSFVFFFDLTVLDPVICLPLFLLLSTVLPHVDPPSDSDRLSLLSMVLPDIDPPSDSVTLSLLSSIVNMSGILIREEHNTDNPMACTKTQ